MDLTVNLFAFRLHLMMMVNLPVAGVATNLTSFEPYEICRNCFALKRFTDQNTRERQVYQMDVTAVYTVTAAV